MDGHLLRAAVLLLGLGALGACQTTGAGTGQGASAAARAIPPLTISHPNALIGEDETALRAALGNPALLRKDEPAQVWQYRGRACVMDFFLYEENGRHAITHVEARGRSGGTARLEDCLQDVHRARYLPGTALL